MRFTAVFREEIIELFQSLCKEEFEAFTKLFMLYSDLDSFLSSKHNASTDSSSREYFTRLFNVRAKDHFSSALILVSQGFTVDAISLTRASLEDLFVVLNFYLDPDYFAKWHTNHQEFKIKPYVLRNNPNISEQDRDLYNTLYDRLSKIVHPKINSIDHMSKFHPSFKNKGYEGAVRLKKDAGLIVLSFGVYLHQMSILLKSVYTDIHDQNALETIRNRVLEIPTVKLLNK